MFPTAPLPRRHHPSLPPPTASRGVALIEAMIAILVFSLGVLALAGFQANAIRQGGLAQQRANAAFIANQMESDIWGVDPGSLSSCAGTFTAGSGTSCAGDWGSRLEALPEGTATVTVNNTEIRIELFWKTPGETDEHKYIHVATVTRNI